jgi:hypothetical protein
LIADAWSAVGAVAAVVAALAAVVALAVSLRVVKYAGETVKIARSTLDEETRQRRLAQLDRMLDLLTTLGEFAEKLKRGPEVLPEQWAATQRRLRMALAVWNSLGGSTLLKCEDANEMHMEHPPHEEKTAIVGEAIDEVLETLVKET